MDKTVTRILLLLLMSAAASVGVPALGQSPAPALPARTAPAAASQAAPALQAQKSVARYSKTKKRARNPWRLADVRTPQQVDLTIRFQ